MDENKNQPKIDPIAVIKTASKVPMVKINREKFLSKELGPRYTSSQVNKAIEYSPAYAGIPREEIDVIAKQVIKYETNKTTAISFAAGIPGGIAIAATIPADISQYFAFILRAMQKLAFLYGFPDFDFSEDDINDETMNRILIFLGVMFGVQEAQAGVKIVADAVAKTLPKKLVRYGLTKTAIYPIVKKVCTALGMRMTTEIFADSVGKMVPIIGGFVCGSLTYATFRPNCIRLMKSFQELPIADPKTFKSFE